MILIQIHRIGYLSDATLPVTVFAFLQHICLDFVSGGEDSQAKHGHPHLLKLNPRN